MNNIWGISLYISWKIDQCKSTEIHFSCILCDAVADNVIRGIIILEIFPLMTSKTDIKYLF